MSELKPCPFCGRKAKISYLDYSELWFIRCSDHECEVCPFLWRKTEAEAIEAWNRRANDAD